MAYKPPKDLFSSSPEPPPDLFGSSDESDFKSWYADRSSKLGLDPNPDAPEHFYDYRAAHKAGAEPDATGHWPSEFKKEGHPRMVIDGVNTKTGERVPSQASPSFLDSISSYVPGPVKSAYNWASEAPSFISEPIHRGAKSLSEYINPMGETKGARGVGSAFVESLGNVIPGLASPMNLATMGTLSGAGMAARAGLPTVARGLGMTGRALSAPVMAHGAYGVATGETLPEKLMGGVEAVGGYFGTKAHPEVLPVKKPGISGVKPMLGDLTSEELSGLQHEFNRISPNKPATSEVPVVQKTHTSADYATDIAHLKARGQEVPPELEALAKPEVPPDLFTPGQPISEFHQRIENMRADTARMEAENAKPLPIEQQNYNEDWNRSQRNAARYEGRNINDVHTPLTPEQQQIRDSYKRIQAHSDKYGNWFAEQENQLPEGEFFKPPPEIKAKFESEQSALHDAHEALVNKLSPLEKPRPPTIDAQFTSEPASDVSALESQIPPEMQQSFNVDNLQGLERAPNASGESAASAEALSRQKGMRDRSEQYVVYDRAGRKRVLIGPEAVDYNPQAGETYGVETPRGFVKLTDNGGNTSTAGKIVSPRRKEYPGYKGNVAAEGTAQEAAPPTGRRQAAEFGPSEEVPPPPPTQTGSSGGGPPKPPPKLLAKSELNPDLPVTGRKAPEARKASLASELYNLPRGLMSMDLPFMTSAAFRQASPLAWTGNWLKAWTKAAKAYGSQASHDAMQADINNSKYFQSRYEPIMDKTGNTVGYTEKPSIAEEIGLKTTDLKHLTSREESIASGLAEKIPVYGHAVRASNRAYTAFLNDLRKNTLESLMEQGKSVGNDPETNLALGKEIASFINNATGRGELKAGIPGAKTLGFGNKEVNLEGASKLLTNALFSPRLMASRIKFLNPATYEQASPMMRQEYMNGLARSTATWWGLAGLAEMAGAAVNKDPNNADFGKIKVGNTRIDPGAGFQQYLVLMSRMRPSSMGGGFTSSTSGKSTTFGQGYKPRTRLSTAQEFAANKLHPTARLAYDMMNASSEKPFNVGDETVQRVIPMMVTDIIQASKDSPELAALVGALSSVGMGTQTYEPGKFKEPTYIPRGMDITLTGR